MNTVPNTMREDGFGYAEGIEPPDWEIQDALKLRDQMLRLGYAFDSLAHVADFWSWYSLAIDACWLLGCGEAHDDTMRHAIDIYINRPDEGNMELH